MKKVLLGSFVAIALLTGCSDSTETKTEKPVETEVKVEKEASAESKLVDQVKESTAKITQVVKEASSEVASKVAEESKEIAEKSSEAAKSIGSKAEVVAKELTDEIVNKTKEAKDNIETSINNIVETKTDTNVASKGKSLYLKCAGCHGQNGDMKALGKSQIIKGWDKQKVLDALVGYKEGTYGAAMKGVMIAQVSSLSNEDLDILSEYIASFK
ncbi:c-type cytochrome [Halarcobacter bivalviorum]|uniref:c-type cytochrome n=1 Tax=Halarcobacter bivalviorum TaxID=663364 RepID=UPI00100BB04D|nr:c-type cytochrome [Halarcobacter bivalviorum]